MKKGTLKTIIAMACVTAVGVVPVFANVIADNLSASASASASASSSASVSYVLGDVTGDGKVKLDDTTLTLKAALAIIDFDEEQTARADFDGDGKIKLADATSSLKVALNIPL